MSAFTVQAVTDWRVTVLEDRGAGHTTTWEIPLSWVDGPIVGEPLRGVVFTAHQVAQPQPLSQEPVRHVGDTGFEGWLSCHEPDRNQNRTVRYSKQDMRDAFWAGYQEAAAPQVAQPIDMVLHCPACGLQHIDKPEGQFYPGMTADESDAQNKAFGLWDNPPHRSHLCHGCGHIWRPADVPTNGVAAVQTKGKADSPIAAPQVVQEFDVRRIMLDVVPGEDGGGVEVYATCVADVERKLSEMGQRIEELEPRPVNAPQVAQPLTDLLREAGELFRFYERSHRAKGPGHEAKAQRNAEIAERIEWALGIGQEGGAA